MKTKFNYKKEDLKILCPDCKLVIRITAEVDGDILKLDFDPDYNLTVIVKDIKVIK